MRYAALLKPTFAVTAVALALTGCTDKVAFTDTVTATGVVRESSVHTLVLDKGATKPNPAAIQAQIHRIDPSSHAAVTALGALGIVIVDHSTEAITQAADGQSAERYDVSMESTSDSASTTASSPGKGEYISATATSSDSSGTSDTPDPITLTQTAHTTTFAVTWTAKERKDMTATLAMLAASGASVSETLRMTLPGKVTQRTGVQLNADGSFTVNPLTMTNLKVVATR